MAGVAVEVLEGLGFEVTEVVFSVFFEDLGDG